MAGTASEVVKSLVVNIVIAVAKGVAAAITGSGAMLAETLHSFADCGNQLLLLLGIKQSSRRPTPIHPLGYGRSRLAISASRSASWCSRSCSRAGRRSAT